MHLPFCSFLNPRWRYYFYLGDGEGSKLDAKRGGGEQREWLVYSFVSTRILTLDFLRRDAELDVAAAASAVQQDGKCRSLPFPNSLDVPES